ncbi:unnamed protein product [Vitrella brassicaformis CCMP3155]|uniref:Uncharacterized protein n=1 Tax=Vitrella brassicaformis (strain CCMP3155) TaxID=1169540 RepID=A0A0G4EMY7_VITBC|nr:unnamed protein product [Vitrella brassicaformis CCMP3155]|eukprot:CEL98180.1 unnamed protein product [Vitrella brassicaformis CCMP3155]
MRRFEQTSLFGHSRNRASIKQQPGLHNFCLLPAASFGRLSTAWPAAVNGGRHSVIPCNEQEASTSVGRCSYTVYT